MHFPPLPTSTVITVTTPSFNSTSYLEFPNLFSNTSTSTIRLVFNAAAPRGLLFYSGNTTLYRDFISLSLVDQRVEFRYDLGSGPAILISAPIALNTWHTVYAARVRRDGMLVVDNMAPVRRQSVGTTTQLDVRGGIFVGGVRDYSHVSSMAGSEVGFIGCIDTLEVSNAYHDIPSNKICLPHSQALAASVFGHSPYANTALTQYCKRLKTKQNKTKQNKTNRKQRNKQTHLGKA